VFFGIEKKGGLMRFKNLLREERGVPIGKKGKCAKRRRRQFAEGRITPSRENGITGKREAAGKFTEKGRPALGVRRSFPALNYDGRK